jgi:hypothetical protein
MAPPEVITQLRQIDFHAEGEYRDWRNTEYCHCTVKAIDMGVLPPSETDLNLWENKARAILNRQKQLNINLCSIIQFPTAVVAKITSESLFSLHRELFKVLPSSQPSFEDANYIPHISLIPLCKNTKIRIDENCDKLLSNINFKVKEIQLVVWNIKDWTKTQIVSRFKLET